jgi:hypothetical protein
MDIYSTFEHLQMTNICKWLISSFILEKTCCSVIWWLTFVRHLLNKKVVLLIVSTQKWFGVPFLSTIDVALSWSEWFVFLATQFCWGVLVWVNYCMMLLSWQCFTNSFDKWVAHFCDKTVFFFHGYLLFKYIWWLIYP